MPVAIDIRFRGVTLDEYDQSVAKMGLTPRGKHVPGCLFHWVTATDDGFRVIDVWETREQFDQFVDDRIAPTMAELGYPNPPEMEFSEVHNYFTAG
jgi:hypothetical protein